ncbi:MAG: class I SAM-dependent methyltransferase [Acidobacteria bacterium]|nr:class I SAM-dependent methyltransferase [Acidobacteriota bacterium]
MIGKIHWRRVAEAAPLDEVREAILTGYLDGKPFSPYAPLLEMPRLERVLDFGCGLGRNFPYLRSAAHQVVGFDLEQMLQRCRLEVDHDGVELTADWPWVRRQHFDCVFACLVLQHIAPDDLRTYLSDFATMAPWLYVLSRGRSDFGGGVFQEIASTGTFTGTVCNVVEHDPTAHGLKHCAAVPLWEALADDRHYEVLLASTVSR